MYKVKLYLLSFSLLFLVMGCTTMNKIVPPSTDLIINVSKNVNPDTSERPSPVVMKIFELSSRTIFDTQDFFSLYDTPEKILGPDLLKKDELELQPDSIQQYKMSLNRNTRYVGVVVAYRNIDQARWRAVIEVDPTGYDDINVNVEAIATYMREQ
ncbi:MULTISPECIES: type VI secretion system lipoprotein TssJ [Pseudoalteromonas]|jgi:type VI secretion system protein VasD|uniref:Type VI secretion system lipoprotein TssJ n=1 Tax=Pseudoalteromonas undina TaxID=43660 RepID=A0ABN0NIB0_9GAMM|nr:MULTISPECIES: type VI secretion system lipoprotein TssJ [Pseudoalteromonas]OLF74713.1 type VI secretion protein VasD [Pseudoalteromonas haloplanktis]KPH91585.1 type VI secretion protein VasD [Pseudoalteromonas undina]KPZ66717.1 Type VI secretion lipoprotein [Pseudoalteromonas sp. P1-16-1b]PWS54936.1 type VI secretion system lipoprotein TssJ [Pseudoalteromonas sp. meg-B1]TMP57005.1 type VI secretion system lipoprotein TssJ [Pseudoalteromonas sp. S1612]